MRLNPIRASVLVALGLGAALLVLGPAGTAEDVDHGPAVKERLATWKAGPHGGLLFQGVRPDPAAAAGPGPRAVALCLGVDQANNGPDHYDGAAPRLFGCAQDATAVGSLARSAGFDVTLLTDDRATTAAVTAFLREQARDRRAGDTLLVYFAGCGGQVPDDPANPDEPAGGKDDTLALYDRQLLDDELFDLLAAFPAGVRLVLVTDSSGTGRVAAGIVNLDQALARPPRAIADALRAGEPEAVARARATSSRPLLGQPTALPNVRFRLLDPGEADRVYRDRPVYREVEGRRLKGEAAARAAMPATLIHLAATTDNAPRVGPAVEMNGHGLFTAALIDAWDGGKFPGTYRQLVDDIATRTGGQAPQYARSGPADPAFEARPFRP
jgi:hypothetical protein